MEKSPYDEFICSNSKDIGPAPWNQVPQPLGQNELLEEKYVEIHGDPHEEKIIERLDEPHKEEVDEARNGLQEANVERMHGGPKRLTYLPLPFLFCTLALAIWQNKDLACGAGLTVCLLTQFFCKNDLLSYPFNIPLKAGCSLIPLLQPFHPQLVNEYCDSFSWPWVPRSHPIEGDPFPSQNYASSGAGASIISELTSSTHGVPKRSWRTYFAKSLDYKIHIPPAFVILEDSIIDGECWRISGHTGKVGVRLSAPIIVSHVTLDYLNPALLSSTAIAAAPRNISLWSFVDDLPEFKSFGKDEKKTPSEFVARGEYKRPGVFIRVANFQYNISLPVAKQRFSTQRHVSVLTQDVVLFVESNEGGNTTCMYWVGIHGNTG